MTRKLFLLDGHSLAHRAFYALPLLSNSQGEYTNAVYGFTRMLLKLIDDEAPDMLAVAFDKKAPTFRHDLFDDYKAGRKKMPEEMSPQIPLIKEVLDTFNIPIFELEGYEADDIIGTIAKKAEKEGIQVFIVTGDRDAFQLISDRIKVIYTKRGISDIDIYSPEKIEEKYGLNPKQLVDMKGLMGDSSDNIPGVPGVGEKTAIKLLKEFPNLEELLDNIDKVSGKKRKENLRKYKEQARLSKKLGKIILNVPIDINLNKCTFDDGNQKSIYKLFKRLGFNTMLDRFAESEILNPDEIKIKEVNKKEEIDDLCKKIEDKGSCALTVNLSDFDNPVQADFQYLLLYLSGEDSVYLVRDINDTVYFKDVFENDGIRKLMYNAKESIIKLKKNKINLNGLKFEALLAKYLLKPSDNLPDMKTLFERELEFSIPEDILEEKVSAHILTKLFQLEEIFKKRLQENDLLDLFTEIEIPLITVLADMEYNGINVDESYLELLSKKWHEKLREITERVYEIAGVEFNLNSPKQLGEVLFEKLKLPVIKKTGTGAYSTGISVLEKLEDKHEIIPLIMDYRQWSKLKTTYIDALPPLINKESGRIHTSFNQMVTATGRLSSTNPNLQNIPIRTREGREIRKAFIPGNNDMIFLAADYSQVELRVMAHISDDKGLQRAFNAGRDIHSETASEIFEVESDGVTANMRRHAKVINFGLAYGMSSYGLAQDLDISRKEADNYIERYFNKFPGVKEYMDKIIADTKKNTYVETLFRRRRYIPEINSKNFHKRSFAERIAINTPIQGTAADIMKKAMIDVYNALLETNYEVNILLQVHDELVLEANRKQIADLAVLLKNKMEKTVSLNVPLIVDLQIGENWRDKEEYEVE